MYRPLRLPILLPTLFLLINRCIALPPLSLSQGNIAFRSQASSPHDPTSTFEPRDLSSDSLNPYPTHKRVTFRPDGTLHLTIFSDLHFGENPWDDWGPQQDVNSLALMREVLVDPPKVERPDYVVLNGDLITGENTFKENSTDLINEILAPLVQSEIPFSSTYGNHDNSVNVSHIAEIEREMAVAPQQSYTRIADPSVGGEGGPGNYWVPIYLKDHDPTPLLILWFFDSRGCEGCPTDQADAITDYVDASVADWIERETKKMDEGWGDAVEKGRHAMAFVHIPPHTIQAVQTTLDPNEEPGLNADVLGSGSTQDSNTASKDTPFWDSLNKNVKNLRAVISGHDHGNEWCAREPTKDVIFCFDKHSGYGGYSSTGWGHGVRHMIFDAKKMDSPQTWIWIQEGDVITANVTLDGSYGR